MDSSTFNQICQDFLARIDQNMADIGLDLEQFDLIDHLCFRVATTEEYHAYLSAFECAGKPFGAPALINGRDIVTFELSPGIQYKKFKINALELPDIKESSPYKTGMQHIEIILENKVALEKLLADHPQVPFETKALNHIFDPEIEISFSDASCVKFHTRHILDKIRIEQKIS